MKQRIEYTKIAPDGYKAMAGLEGYVRRSGLEPSLLELVKTRASLINGCAFCLDMHTKDARDGRNRAAPLHAWEETPFFSERERAALAWTEAVTRVADTHVPDDVFESVRKHFSEKELADLTVAIVAVNGWNRLAISFRTIPGTYQPAKH